MRNGAEWRGGGGVCRVGEVGGLDLGISKSRIIF